MSLFSKNLRFLRKKGDHKQEEISALFHKRANTIGNWENQKSEPSLTELMMLGDYFRVSIQDLLHSDLEAQSYNPNRETAGAGSSLQKVKTYELQEPVHNLASETGPDAFWLILRELRAVNEKVDMLLSRMKSVGLKMNSDKSSH